MNRIFANHTITGSFNQCTRRSLIFARYISKTTTSFTRRAVKEKPNNTTHPVRVPSISAESKTFWTPDELRIIGEMKSKAASWDEIAAKLSNRSPAECRQLWTSITGKPLTAFQKQLSLPGDFSKISWSKEAKRFNVNVFDLYQSFAHQILVDGKSPMPPSVNTENQSALSLQENKNDHLFKKEQLWTRDQGKFLLELEERLPGQWNEIATQFADRTGVIYTPVFLWSQWAAMMKMKVQKQCVWTLQATIRLLETVVGQSDLNWPLITKNMQKHYSTFTLYTCKYHLEYVRCCPEIWSLDAVLDLLNSSLRHSIDTADRWDLIAQEMKSHGKTARECRRKFLAVYRTTLTHNQWLRKERRLITELMTQHNSDWEKIAEELPLSMTPQQLEHYVQDWRNRKRGVWSTEERELLCRLVLEFQERKAPIDWSVIAKQLKRPQAACWRRFYRYDDPRIKRTPFTPEEDFQLHMLVKRFGVGRWAALARAWNSGRTDEMCRHRWNSIKRREKKPSK